MNLAADPIHFVTSKHLYLGLSTIDALAKLAALWAPAARVGRPKYVVHWSAPNHVFGETIEVGDAVSAKSDYNYRTDFETWTENQEFELQKNARSQPPLD